MICRPLKAQFVHESKVPSELVFLRSALVPTYLCPILVFEDLFDPGCQLAVKVFENFP